MSITVFVSNRTFSLTPSSNASISSIIEQTLAKAKITESNYGAYYQDKLITDVSKTLRQAQIPQGASIYLRKQSGKAKSKPVKVALQVPSGKRLAQEIDSNTSLLDLLKQAGNQTGLNFTEVNQPFSIPEIVFMNRKFNLSQLQTVSIASIGAQDGLLRLTITPSKQTLEAYQQANPTIPLLLKPPEDHPIQEQPVQLTQSGSIVSEQTTEPEITKLEEPIEETKAEEPIQLSASGSSLLNPNGSQADVPVELVIPERYMRYISKSKVAKLPQSTKLSGA
jgi:hypothetical protein